MAQEPRSGPPRPGQKRHQGTAIFCSNYELNQLHRENIPFSSFRVYENQRIPALINQMPAKIPRTHMGLGIKNSCRPHKASRKNHLPLGQTKIQTEELLSIREELSQIKAQVDHLLQSLEHMDQRKDQHAGEESST